MPSVYSGAHSKKHRNYSGLLTACGSSQEVFVLGAVPSAAAQPPAQKDASRRSRVPIYLVECRFIQHVTSRAARNQAPE